MFQLSVDELVAEAQAGWEAGVRAVILFGVPETRTRRDRAPTTTNGDRAAGGPGAQEGRCPGLVVITDVCLCEYTDHGHCGVLKPPKAGGPAGPRRRQRRDARRCSPREAVAHARAGADIVAPSDMMDGRVGRHPRGARRAPASATCPSSPTPPSSPAPSTGRSATPPRARRAGPGDPKDRKGYQMDPANVARGHARGGARHRRGRRHGHGEAGRRPTSTSSARCATASSVPVAAYHVSRRVRDDQGRRRARLDRRGARGARDPAVLPPGRRRLHPHLHAKDAARLLTGTRR